MKRRALAVILAAVLCVPVTAIAEPAHKIIGKSKTDVAEPVVDIAPEESDSNQNENESKTSDAPKASAEGLSDNLFDFQIAIDGDVYQFPMTYEEFLAKGWTLDDYNSEDEMLGTSSYSMVYFDKNDWRVMGFAMNFDINERPIKECLITGIDIAKEFDELDHAVELPKGIVYGTSTLEDIENAYGEPSDTYEGELYTKVTYEQDYYESVALYVYNDSNVLNEIEIRNFVKPDDFETGEVSKDIPDIVTAYSAPEALGEELMDPIVEYCGDLYQLPCPLSAFLANGWEITDMEDGAYLAGREMEVVELVRGTQSVRVYDYNLTENATAIENGFITTLDYASYDADNISMTLSGGVTLGAKRGDLLKMAEEKGYYVEESESDLMIAYQEDGAYYNNVSFWFNTNEDADTSASIEYRKSKLD